MNVFDIDFARLYREHVRRTGHHQHTPEYWDGRAPAMSNGIFDSAYVNGFVARMDLAGCRTLLDIGCGPGTIGLSVASRLDHVYGLDYSPGMLAAFDGNARARGLTNVTSLLRSWEDDWFDVPVCDVVVASRSTAVADLEAAVIKLDGRARRRVYLTYPADGRLVPDTISRVIGRESETRPDYLYAIGVLHHLGIRPRLDYLQDDRRRSRPADFETFRASAVHLVGDMTTGETERLRAWFSGESYEADTPPMIWAFISWDARGAASR